VDTKLENCDEAKTIRLCPQALYLFSTLLTVRCTLYRGSYVFFNGLFPNRGGDVLKAFFQPHFTRFSCISEEGGVG